MSESIQADSYNLSNALLDRVYSLYKRSPRRTTNIFLSFSTHIRFGPAKHQYIRLETNVNGVTVS